MSKTLQSRNPATGELLASFEPHGATQIGERLATAARTTEPWGRASAQLRADVLTRVAELLEEDESTYARLMALEMGKPLTAAAAELQKCGLTCRYYADNAESLLASELMDGPDQRVELAPLGVILAVMPWNFPFWQVIRFAAPALLAGNVALLKHASNVPQCALALEELFGRAGAPEGVFQTLLVGADAIEGIIADDRVAAVTVTGSESAGREVAAVAGKHLKKVVLELGGNDPFVVLPTADLSRAIPAAVKSRCVNSGQSCIAAKRFVVCESVHDHRFVEGLVAGMNRLRMGDPLDPTTELGPLATAGIRSDLDEQVRRSIAAGARALCGGGPRPGAGNFYEPTVLVDVPRNAPAWREELFGPVATVVRAADVDEAIRMANDSPFGLAASVWTGDRAEADRVARALETGTVFVNEMVSSDPRFPFGGIKRSGHGRELGAWGLREFVNVKTIRVFHMV